MDNIRLTKKNDERGEHMKRNVKKVIEARRDNIPSAYNISHEDVGAIDALASDGQEHTAVLGFIYGYEMGVRAERHKHANKRHD